jgi:protein translocase SecG subunit
VFFIDKIWVFVVNCDYMTQQIGIITVLLSIAIIALILIQNKGAGLSSTFGGGSEVYLTKRGMEKWVINGTILAITLFVIVRITAFYIG